MTLLPKDTASEGTAHVLVVDLAGDDPLLEADLGGQFQGSGAAILAKIAEAAIQQAPRFLAALRNLVIISIHRLGSSHDLRIEGTRLLALRRPPTAQRKSEVRCRRRFKQLREVQGYRVEDLLLWHALDTRMGGYFVRFEMQPPARDGRTARAALA